MVLLIKLLVEQVLVEMQIVVVQVCKMVQVVGVDELVPQEQMLLEQQQEMVV
jgi:hypothetical protein